LGYQCRHYYLEKETPMEYFLRPLVLIQMHRHHLSRLCQHSLMMRLLHHPRQN
jgi:hypothetical protein